MKIYSWNMLYRNPDFGRAYSFIEHLDFDVLCLQEVPERFLERLHTLPVYIASCIDADRIKHQNTIEHTFCVILSRYPIEETCTFDFPQPPRPLRTRLFVRLMRPAGWHFVTNHHSLYADITVPDSGRLRVFCLHLTLSHPRARRAEFDIAMRHLRKDSRAAVCGDFNILESPHVTLLNWLLGGRFLEIFAWSSERMDMEKRFAELGLQNPLRGVQTQVIARSQLDHILVSNPIRVDNAQVFKDRCGSDHHPVFIEFGT